MIESIKHSWQILKSSFLLSKEVNKDIITAREMKVAIVDAKPTVFVRRSAQALTLAIPASAIASHFTMFLVSRTEVWKVLVIVMTGYMLPIAIFIYIVLSIFDGKISE